MADRTTPLPGYRSAIEWLQNNRPHMVDYVQSLGLPQDDLDCPRAMVVSDRDLKPKLYVNDQFLQDIGAAQAAGVLAHEWRHVLLGHASERFNPKPEWRLTPALVDSHEVVINDSLELTGYELPDDVIRGDNRGGHFYGYWTTEEAYGPMEEWYLEQMKQNPSQGDGNSTDSSEGEGESQEANGQASSPSADADSQPGQGGSEVADSSNGSDADGATSSDGCSTGLPRYIEDGDGDLREMTDGELKDFLDGLKRELIDVLEDTPLPEDEKPSEAELDEMDQDVAKAVDSDRKGLYSKAGTEPDPLKQILAGDKIHIGWVKLLQKINPKVGKPSGGLNAKASYNWARPRRTTSLIRGANLPSAGDPRDAGVGTEHKPVALIALDQSISIDRRLASAMRDMAQSIPAELIEAHCFTFSTYTVAFDFKSPINEIAGGGTDFSCIEEEARKIEASTGKYPHVICLTDGQAWFYRGAAPTDLNLHEKWLWVDVLTEEDSRAFRNGTSYGEVRKQRNLSALPYDRSKLR